MRFPHPTFATGKGEHLHTGMAMAWVRTAAVRVRTAAVRLARPQGLELMLPGIIGQASQGECLIHDVASSPFHHTCVIVPLRDIENEVDDTFWGRDFNVLWDTLASRKVGHG